MIVAAEQREDVQLIRFNCGWKQRDLIYKEGFKMCVYSRNNSFV